MQKVPPTGLTSFEFPAIRKAYYVTLLMTSALLGINFYSGILVTMTRGETFGRNLAVIEQKYGEVHRQALGEDKKISKYGYPDMGGNIYADLLPYKDWVKMNSAQRCHEVGYEHAMLLLPNLFIISLAWPRLPVYILSMFVPMRFLHI